MARIFKRNKKKIEIKVLAALLYFLKISLRRLCRNLKIYVHETVTTGVVLKQSENKKREIVAIDE